MNQGEPNQLEGLSGFMKELAEQACERYVIWKREVDEELADRISERRIQVERTLRDLRLADERHRTEGLRSNRHRAEASFAEAREQLRARLFEELERRLLLRLQRLRSSGEYALVLQALIQEVTPSLEGELVMYAEKEDVERLKKENSSLAERLSGTLNDVWGGVLIVDQATGRVLDNTFHSRWKRLEPDMMSHLSERLDRSSVSWAEMAASKGKSPHGT
ncbi:MAG: hypothetical protein GX256_08705 [Fretibacterium sp.]|nr:hypothetical protein [Fretibacterium sp.]